jgi:serine/tyrosine/threonine adenylyltransferase
MTDANVAVAPSETRGEAGRFASFDNSYARLSEQFFARLPPTPVASPKLVRLNEPLARELGLDPVFLSSPEGVAILAGNRVAEGSEPIAAAYAGHQFGHFVPQLGDGRAILLGEVVDRSGRRRDIQLKGSGPTPFSRRGDGRAALGPVLREYLVSESMAALGVPTTRALAAVTTGEMVFRETPLPGAVLTRVAASHIRVGTFQFFAARGDTDAVRQLVEHVIQRHYPEARDAANPYRSLLEGVIARQARLVAQWLSIGFIHGVMNTDNMSIAGETIDYGPCAFMDAYHPGTVFSSIDENGRYAYANQPAIAQWNLARLAETLLPLLASDETAALAEANAALATYAPLFNAAYIAAFRRKLGLTEERPDDLGLIQGLLDVMAGARADFTVTFRRLSGASADAALSAMEGFDAWAVRWRARLSAETASGEESRALMRASNPAYIPRNHLVEEMIQAAVNQSDFAPFGRLLGVLSGPYDDQPGAGRFALPPRPEEVVHQTFCGT